MTYYHLPQDERTYSEAHVLIDIERLVEMILARDAQGTIQSSGLNRISIFSEFYLGALLDELPKYLVIYSPFHEYSTHLKVFWASCFKAAIIVRTHESFVFQLGSIEQVRTLLSSIIEFGLSPQFFQQIHDRMRALQSSYQVIQDYDQALRDQYSDLVCFRLDLGYRHEQQHEIDIETVHRHLNSFIRVAKMRTGYLEDLVGSFRVIVQCEQGGYHVHAVFYYERSKPKRNWHYCHQISENWLYVTNLIGIFEDCNASTSADNSLHTSDINTPHHYGTVDGLNNLLSVGFPTQDNHLFSHLRMWPRGSRMIVTGEEEF